MSNIIFAATRPAVYVPAIILLILLSLIWVKGSDRRTRDCLAWILSYLAVCGGLIAIAYVQYTNGCGFGLADCYSDLLPDYLWILKLLAIFFYYFWAVAAGLSALRRMLGVSDESARKFVIAGFGSLGIVVVLFIAFLRFKYN